MWGYYEDGELLSVCHSAANLMPAMATPEALDALRRAGPVAGPPLLDDARARRRPSSRCGSGCRREWPAPREVRARPAAPRDRRRPPLVDARPAGPPEPPRRARHRLPRVRRDVHRGGRRLPGGARRRSDVPRPRRAADLPAAGRSSASRTAGWCSRRRSPRRRPHACQVQGVYVAPDRRGEGLGTAGMAAVVGHGAARDRPGRLALRQRRQRAARRVYEQVGFRRPRPSRPCCSDASDTVARVRAPKDVALLAGIFTGPGWCTWRPRTTSRSCRWVPAHAR